MGKPRLHPMAEAVQWLSRITTIAGVMVAPAAAGAWLDRRLGTGWLAAGGLLLGFTGGLWLILRLPGAVAVRRGEPGGDRDRHNGLIDRPARNPADGDGGRSPTDRQAAGPPTRNGPGSLSSLWLVAAAGLSLAGLSLTRGLATTPALVACLATLPGAVAGRIVSTRRPKDAAAALAAGLGGAVLRFAPALATLGWLTLPATRRGLPSDTAVWLVVTYLAVLATDIGLHILWGRRQTMPAGTPDRARHSPP